MLGQKLPPPGKYYLCFQMDGITAHAAQCSRSRSFTKVVGLIIQIHSFEHQCVIIKGLLNSEKLKQHVVSIGVEQSLSNCAMHEHRCLLNIKKL